MDTKKDLNSNDVDKGVVLLKGFTGAFPLIGPMVAEIIGSIIPYQREDRMKEFLLILDEKFTQLEISQEELSLKMKEESYINLFEDGLLQSSRASSKERKEYIASLLANGISSENLENIEENILLYLLGQLNDAEIVILYSHTRSSRTNEEFRTKHEDTLMPPIAYLGSSQEEHEKVAIYKTYREKLVRLNLLEKKFKTPRKNELPEFDMKTGMVKEDGYKITILGRLFLKYIDMPDEV